MNVEELNGRPLRLLIFGFPCTKFSVCQKTENREVEPNSGEGWELFLNGVIAKEKFKPDYFMVENNHSISQSVKDAIIYDFINKYSEGYSHTPFNGKFIKWIRKYDGDVISSWCYSVSYGTHEINQKFAEQDYNTMIFKN